MPIEWPFTYLTKELINSLYDRHHEGVLICDAQARLVYYNARMSDFDHLTSEEVVGLSILDIYHLTWDTSITCRSLRSEKHILNQALYYRTSKGTLVNAICNAYPIFENNILVGVICYTAEYSTLADRLNITARNYAYHPYSKDITPHDDSKAANGADHTMASIIGNSPGILSLLETAKVASKTNSSVMIYGETGTGKELFAQAIHNQGPRRANLFCPINCAAIPENLLEGILFGTVKGAFTGALERKGLFEVSSGGTIFLDEIHTMPLGLQAKLLRVVQESKIRRVGSLKETPVDLKIISSINQKPEEAVEKGLLRLDLFYRLSVINLSIPPLRMRPSDVGELVAHFVKKYNKKFQGRIKRVENEFLAIMENHNWPGNVRELEHVVETSMNFAVADKFNDNSLGLRHIQSVHLRKFLLKKSNDQPQKNQITESKPTLNEEMNRAEKEKLKETLKISGYNVTKAASNLGLSRQALYYKLKKYDLNKNMEK